MSTTSPTLLQRLKDPFDQEAWSRLVSLYTPLLRYWARNAGASSLGASELIQEVFLVLLKTLRDFRYDPQGSFRGWLRTITVRKWHELHRGPPAISSANATEAAVAVAPPFRRSPTRSRSRNIAATWWLAL